MLWYFDGGGGVFGYDRRTPGRECSVDGGAHATRAMLYNDPASQQHDEAAPLDPLISGSPRNNLIAAIRAIRSPLPEGVIVDLEGLVAGPAGRARPSQLAALRSRPYVGN